MCVNLCRVALVTLVQLLSTAQHRDYIIATLSAVSTRLKLHKNYASLARINIRYVKQDRQTGNGDRGKTG